MLESQPSSPQLERILLVELVALYENQKLIALNWRNGGT